MGRASMSLVYLWHPFWALRWLIASFAYCSEFYSPWIWFKKYTKKVLIMTSSNPLSIALHTHTANRAVFEELEPKVNTNERDYFACWIEFAFDTFAVVSCCVYYTFVLKLPWCSAPFTVCFIVWTPVFRTVISALHSAWAHWVKKQPNSDYCDSFEQWIYDFEFILELFFECDGYSSSSFPF